MYRLIYKSRSKSPIDWGLIDSILKASEKNNPESDITGALLATRTHFLQVIEGSFETVNELFYAIAKDPRHDSVQLVGFGCVETRIFPDWTMHGIGIFDLNQEIAERLKHAFGEEDGGVRLPTDEWQALALINDIRHSQD
jgi:hypothetical protein